MNKKKLCSLPIFLVKAHICFIHFSLYFFSSNLVCAEAFNPDEEEEDTDPRVRTTAKVLSRVVVFPTHPLDSPHPMMLIIKIHTNKNINKMPFEVLVRKGA